MFLATGKLQGGIMLCDMAFSFNVILVYRYCYIDFKLASREKREVDFLPLWLTTFNKQTLHFFNNSAVLF